MKTITKKTTTSKTNMIKTNMLETILTKFLVLVLVLLSAQFQRLSCSSRKEHWFSPKNSASNLGTYFFFTKIPLFTIST